MNMPRQVPPKMMYENIMNLSNSINIICLDNML